MFDWTFKLGDIAIVIATLAGPVLAVQAQKWIERSRETKQRRIWIFRTLMATRAASLSPAHVEALNAVPIEFYGNSGHLKEIVDSWKAYLDYLSQQSIPPEVWAQKRFDLFIDLLLKMAIFLGYNFNKVEISREVYSPRAHAQTQHEQDIIRQGLAKLFRGEISLPMDVKGFPVDPQFVQNQNELQKRLLSWLAGEHSVKVALEKEGNDGGNA
jgi:hypothetical protein